MKTTITALFIFLTMSVSAQLTINCNSNRFDQEVFSNVTTTSDIQFGSNIDANGANLNLTMDIYEPTGDTMQARPLIVWAHGGSFLSGTKNDGDVVSLSQHFAKRGYVCVSINYRLGIPFPINQESALKAVYRAVQDMRGAIRYMRKDAATVNLYKIDPNTIFAGGTSAGAFTALHVGYLDKYSEMPIAIDTVAMGTIEGNSGSPGYSSSVNAIIDLCGALGNKTYLEPGDVPFVAMHGTTDNVVPYATDMIYVLGAFPVMIVDGSYSISDYANTIGVQNEMYTYFGAGHVPFVSSVAYMDTTVRFVSNFLYRFFGCTPIDPSPFANTFTTGVDLISSESQIDLYPNPASEMIQIKLIEKGNYSLTITDVCGRTISNAKFNTDYTTLDIANLNSGIYFYSINNNNKIFSGKFIKN